MVATDDELREQYCRQVEITEGLSQLMDHRRSQEIFAGEFEQRLNAESRRFDFLNGVLDRTDVRAGRRQLLRGVAGAAVTLALCAIAAFWAGQWTARQREDSSGIVNVGDSQHDGDDYRTTEPVDDSVAILRRTVDVRWSGKKSLVTGQAVSPEDFIELLSGLVELQFFRGATLTLQGPARLTIHDLENVVLHEGRAWAHVPGPARGFTIHTPDAEIVDLGTEFGVSVVDGQQTEVNVIDGLVELYRPDTDRAQETRHELRKGQAVAIGGDGQFVPFIATENQMPSTVQLQRKRLQQHYDRWRQWNTLIRNDPRVVMYYDFEVTEGAAAATLPNRKADGASADGTIIGCSPAAGRWPEQTALDFKRPSDRVRFELDVELQSVTLAAWVRVDGLDRRFNSLLLTDEWDLGEFHWQFDRQGRLGFTIRGATDDSYPYTEPLVDLRRLGQWMHIATTFNGEQNRVRHYLNGRHVPHDESLNYDGPLRVGAAELGNWGRPLKGSSPIRNFNGRIDEFLMFSTALSDDEIQEVFDAGNPF